MTDKFPFAFDMNSMKDMFPAFDKMFPTDFQGFDKMMPTQFPAFDFGALQEAQKKNMTAMIEANKAAVSGYQALYKRQAELFEAAVAEGKDRMASMQGQPMTPEAATESFETLKAAFEKGMADLKEMAELAQTANTDAFDIIKARTEEAFGEMKAATDKLAA